MKNTSRKSPFLWLLPAAPILWVGAGMASCYEDGMDLFTLMGRFTEWMKRPFSLEWTPYTPRFLFIALCLYAFAVVLLLSAKQNRRPGEEHGSARWGDPRQLDRKYRDKDRHRNAILTKHLRMSLNSRKHLRNLLQIVVGGSGAGKTRYIVKPNIYEANASYIATDPKGELARDSIPLLLREGYTVKVFDLVDPERSDCYNPFHYIRNDADVLKLIANFIRNTTPKNAHSNDPFWEKSETALDSALMLYLLHEAPPQDQTMEMMLTMLEYGAAKEGDGDHVSPLDLLFQALEEENPEHIALRQYKVFKQAPSETAMSILISAAVRLAPFSLPEIQRITARDELELEKLGERKQAIFCIIPDSNDVSLNFLVGMLYTQAFQELYYQADKVHGGSLPMPVRLMFDEFANSATRS
jgi:type IV secretion system protein VirD4